MISSPVITNRSAGVLLHPTSLPNQFGIGDLGPEAYFWVDALAGAHQSWWQVLPLHPTGYADSPYQALSAFAGNPNLISPQKLFEDGLLNHSDLEVPNFPVDAVDFASGKVIGYKNRLLEKAWMNYQKGNAPFLKSSFQSFCIEEQTWLDDFALYMTIKDAYHGISWIRWEDDLLTRRSDALERAAIQFKDQVEQHKFRQFLFERQWQQLRTYANARGVRLIGDLPIFVSLDSSDVWSHPEFFQLNEYRMPKVIAGVPPDYFSSTGQLWGNPLYNWEFMRQENYDWWIERIRRALHLVNVIRVDHFRGFQAYWEVPGESLTAETGRWVQGPGVELFDVLTARLGSLPIIAEDLGIITPDVDALRTRYGFPGMRILQFAFAGAVEERFLPYNYEQNTVVYTGTHDNDTIRGWYDSATKAEQAFLHKYLGRDNSDISWDLIRLAWSSVAVLAVTPLQDILSLGTEARMNLPGCPSGYWRWRFRKEMLSNEVLNRLGELTEVYGRAVLPSPGMVKAPG